MTGSNGRSDCKLLSRRHRVVRETSSYTSWWDYTAGVLASALGSHQEADQRFRQALLLPDRMLSYHFTRIARAEAAP